MGELLKSTIKRVIETNSVCYTEIEVIEESQKIIVTVKVNFFYKLFIGAMYKKTLLLQLKPFIPKTIELEVKIKILWKRKK